MGAPKGNEFYKLRKKHGRNPIYKDPEKMAEDINNYFEWCLQNPLKEEIIVNKKWTEVIQDPDDPEKTITREHGHAKGNNKQSKTIHNVGAGSIPRNDF